VSPRKLTTSLADAGAPLAAWLERRLGLSADEIGRRVAAGAVYVNGARERDADRCLVAGERVVVHEPPAATPLSWRVVYENADVVVVDKPPGLPTVADRGGGRALDLEVAQRYAGARAFHRIDRETSGLVLFTRRRSARQALAAALASGTLERRYAAVVVGAPPDAMVLDAPIGPDPADRRRMRAGVPGGRPARSEMRVRDRSLSRATVEVLLVTGLTHQIRVHLSAAGWPIVGDSLYGGPSAPRLALHAERLSWPGGAALSPLPDDVAALMVP
jgi:23S rRNA pseudouridine1911/1915/1917 synthase